MERGCNLEKRCVSCRFLKLQKKSDMLLVRGGTNSKPFDFVDVVDMPAAINKGVIGNLYEDASYYPKYLEEAYSGAIEKVSRILSDIEFDVLKLSTIDELSSAEIAEAKGITTQRVCSVFNRAVKKLRISSFSRDFKYKLL